MINSIEIVKLNRNKGYRLDYVLRAEFNICGSAVPFERVIGPFQSQTEDPKDLIDGVMAAVDRALQDIPVRLRSVVRYGLEDGGP